MSFARCGRCGTELAPGRGCAHFPVFNQPETPGEPEVMTPEEWQRIYRPEGLIVRDEDLAPAVRKIMNPPKST